MSGVQKIHVSKDDDGIKLERWFKRHFPGLTFSRLQKLMRKGDIRLDGKRVKGKEILEKGMMVRVPPLDDDAIDLWGDVEQICADDGSLYGGEWVTRYHQHYHRASGKGRQYQRRMRVAEALCVESGAGPCESVFHLIGPSQVGLSGLSTMRMLQQVRDHPDIAVWPFQDISRAKVVIVEIYAALFAKMGGGGGKIRDARQLETILAALGAAGDAPAEDFDDHKADALVTAAGLATIAGDREYWNPRSLSPMVRESEGWIFGLKA